MNVNIVCLQMIHIHVCTHTHTDMSNYNIYITVYNTPDSKVRLVRSFPLILIAAQSTCSENCVVYVYKVRLDWLPLPCIACLSG